MDQNDQNQKNQSQPPENVGDAKYNPPNRGESSPSGHLGGSVEDMERKYTMSISDEDRRKAFQMEDARWATSEQVKDWLKLGAMVLITVIWSLFIYFIEPGLR